MPERRCGGAAGGVVVAVSKAVPHNARTTPPPPALALRRAAPADIPRLARVWRASWGSANPAVQAVAPLAHWEARARAEFGPPCTTMLIERGQAVQAFMVLDQTLGHLHQLFVAPEAQGHGLGAALVQQICEHLCPRGWTLHVATGNQGARRFYARCGLVEEGTDRHPQTGRERVLCRWAPPVP